MIWEFEVDIRKPSCVAEHALKCRTACAIILLPQLNGLGGTQSMHVVGPCGGRIDAVQRGGARGE